MYARMTYAELKTRIDELGEAGASCLKCQNPRCVWVDAYSRENPGFPCERYVGTLTMGEAARIDEANGLEAAS